MAHEKAGKTTAPRRRLKRSAEVTALNFNDEDDIPPRSGDPIAPEVLEKLLPRRRARLAGLTGASVNADFTADDLSPETLLDEDGADSSVHGGGAAADTILRKLSAEETFSPPPEDPPAGAPRRGRA